MRILRLVLPLALFAAGCSRREPVADAPEAEPAAPVRAALAAIARLEGVADTAARTGRLVRVKGLSAPAFKRILETFPGRDVRVWMPGEHDWYLVGSFGTNRVALADAMDEFAMDTNCTVSVTEVFASYAGTRDEILPAFTPKLTGEVVPEWFVTKRIPPLGWLDAGGIDEDIAKSALAEIRSMQVVRREILRGNMLAARATDKKGEEAATEVWARACLRNPHDPMLLERIENLNRNAKGFLEVGKLLQALKCYETLVLIRPDDAAAVNNFGLCLKRIGKLDLAKKVLARADALAVRRAQR